MQTHCAGAQCALSCASMDMTCYCSCGHCTQTREGHRKIKHFLSLDRKLEDLQFLEGGGYIGDWFLRREIEHTRMEIPKRVAIIIMEGLNIRLGNKDFVRIDDKHILFLYYHDFSYYLYRLLD